MYSPNDSDDSSQSFPRRNKKKTTRRVRRMLAVWTRERVITLIGLVQKHKTIWNTFNEAYKLRDVKDKAWASVAAAMQLDVNECKFKWNSTRSSFRRTHLNAVKFSTSGHLTRKNAIFDSMWFLEPVLLLESNSIANNLTKDAAYSSASSSPSRSERSVDAPSPIIETKVLDATPLHQDDGDDDDDPLLAPLQPQDKSDEAITRIETKKSSALQPDNQTEPFRLRSQHQPQPRLDTNGCSQCLPVVVLPNSQAIATNPTVLLTNEWDAFGNLIAANARTWSTENLVFARRYKAALSAVNTQFEMEAVEMCDTSNGIRNTSL